MDRLTRLLDISTVTLSEAQRDSLADALRIFRREAILDPAPSTYAAAVQATWHLPAQALRKIVDLRYGVDSDLGCVLLRNTPLDPEIPCQPKPTRLWHDKRTSLTEAMQLVAHAAIGSIPISYEIENGGDTVATLSPKRGDETKQESTSSEILLELHGEDQAHPFPPDTLVLSNLQEGIRKALHACSWHPALPIVAAVRAPMCSMALAILLSRIEAPRGVSTCHHV